jgi:chromosome segregation ATPase
MSSVLPVSEMMKGTWALKCSALDMVYDKCAEALPYIFTDAKKHNKINSLKKSLKGGYVWGSYKFNNGNEFNKKNNDIQYVNCIYDSMIRWKGEVQEKIVEKEVVVEKVVGRYDHYKESTWNELVAKTKENKKLKKKVAELEAQVKEALDGYDEINEKVKKGLEDIKFNKHLDDLLDRADKKIDMVIVDKPTTAEIEVQTDLISEDDKENNWFNYEHIKTELEEMTKIRYASQKKNQRLEEELATAKETIKDMEEQLKSKPAPAPAFDIPVIDGEEIEVCGSSGTTIKYKGDVYWTKNYIDKKFRNKDKTIQNLTNRLEDCHYDLDKSKMTLENYKETWREMQKENKQLKYKLDKGEMYSKKDLMEKLDGKDLEIKRLEKEIAKQDGREELAEVQYENTRLGGILMDKSKKIEELDEELNNAYEELEEVKATLQQYKDHGF